MTRVKICGIRRAEDALAAAQAGAFACGFNFWPGGPRYITPQDAAAIVRLLPKEVWKVAVFVDESSARVLEIADETGISILQFHGAESPEYWDRFATFQRIKAFKAGDGFQPSIVTRYRSAAAYLLDASVSGMHGGTGQTFDWSLAERTKEFGNVILAGGLNTKNVGDAIRRVQPWGVDVASGVETEPGKKDPQLIREFIEAVRVAELEIAENDSGPVNQANSRISQPRL